MRSTHTYATMEVPLPFHTLVKSKLKEAGYDSAILAEGANERLVMQGIALVVEPPAIDANSHQHRFLHDLARDIIQSHVEQHGMVFEDNVARDVATDLLCDHLYENMKHFPFPEEKLE